MEEEARARLPEAVYDYYAGGAGDEQTVADNLEAWRKVWLRARGLVDVAQVRTGVEILGHELSMPVLLAPIAAQGFLDDDGEVATARAAARAGTIFCVSTSATRAPAEVAAAADGPLWFQLYVNRDRSVTEALLCGLKPAGYARVVVTIDLAVIGRRERELRHGAGAARQPGGWDTALTWDDLDWVRETSGLPIVVKGVVTGEDARASVEHGAEAVVVSNHGGRQLDGVSATIDALPEVVEAVDGRIEVLLDGGIRRGADVVKALALGASAVLAGRAPLWGLVVDGEAGARRVLELLRDEVELALQLVGCRTPAELTPAHVQARR